MPRYALLIKNDHDRQVFEDGGRQLGAGHLEASVAVDTDNSGVGIAPPSPRSPPAPRSPWCPDHLMRGTSAAGCRAEYCIAHIWCCPTPVVQITSSRSAVAAWSASMTAWGLTSSPAVEYFNGNSSRHSTYLIQPAIVTTLDTRTRSAGGALKPRSRSTCLRGPTTGISARCEACRSRRHRCRGGSPRPLARTR